MKYRRVFKLGVVKCRLGVREQVTYRQLVDVDEISSLLLSTYAHKLRRTIIEAVLALR